MHLCHVCHAEFAAANEALRRTDYCTVCREKTCQTCINHSPNVCSMCNRPSSGGTTTSTTTSPVITGVRPIISAAKQKQIVRLAKRSDDAVTSPADDSAAPAVVESLKILSGVSKTLQNDVEKRHVSLRKRQSLLRSMRHAQRQLQVFHGGNATTATATTS